MKNKFILTLIFVLTPLFLKAQSCTVEGCLGIHTYISVDLTNDPVTDGYLIYTIPVPSEGLVNNYMFSVEGPGSPYFFNFCGNTVDLYIRKHLLEVDCIDIPCQAFMEFIVARSVDGLDITLSTNGKVRCHYHIVLNISY